MVVMSLYECRLNSQWSASLDGEMESLLTERNASPRETSRVQMNEESRVAQRS
jgi:hypothetical protein